MLYDAAGLGLRVGVDRLVERRRPVLLLPTAAVAAVRATTAGCQNRRGRRGTPRRCDCATSRDRVGRESLPVVAHCAPPIRLSMDVFPELIMRPRPWFRNGLSSNSQGRTEEGPQ